MASLKECFDLHKIPANERKLMRRVIKKNINARNPYSTAMDELIAEAEGRLNEIDAQVAKASSERIAEGAVDRPTFISREEAISHLQAALSDPEFESDVGIYSDPKGDYQIVNIDDVDRTVTFTLKERYGRRVRDRKETFTFDELGYEPGGATLKQAASPDVTPDVQATATSVDKGITYQGQEKTDAALHHFITDKGRNFSVKNPTAEEIKAAYDKINAAWDKPAKTVAKKPPQRSTFEAQVAQVYEGKKDAEAKTRAVMALLDARAKSAGMTTDEYVESRGLTLVPDSKAGTTQQQQENNAAIDLTREGEAIIHVFQTADASSIPHELGHLFRQDLSAGDLAIIEKWAKVKDGKWTAQNEEMFARGWERYLREGKAPTPALQKIFDKFSGWLRNIYKAIKGSQIDVKLTPEVRAVMDRLLTPGAMPDVGKRSGPTLYQQKVGAAEETARSDNQPGVVVGTRPGEFGWSVEANVEPPPIQHPVNGKPRPQQISKAVARFLRTKGAKEAIRTATGIRSYEVLPIEGVYLGVPEPSFVVRADNMADEQSDKLAKLLGWATAQEMTISYRIPQEDLAEGIPTAYIGNEKKLTKKQLQRVIDESVKRGLDLSTTVDGRGVKYHDFDGDPAFFDKVAEIKEAAGLADLHGTAARSEPHYAKDYDIGRNSQAGDSVGRNSAAKRPSAAFRRNVDSLLIPYAKAVGAEGYRLHPDRFAERFGHSQEELAYIKSALLPKGGKQRSTAPVMAGREKLEVNHTVTKAGKKRAKVTDVLWALQNRSARTGLIASDDYSPHAKRAMATSIADEIVYHLNHGGSSAIGWYDAALKKAKEIYYSAFPELKTDKSAEAVFDAILGVTSQGTNVYTNSRNTIKAYSIYRETGNLNDAVKKLYGSFGENTRAIENNIRKLQSLIDSKGIDKLSLMFNKKQTVGQWNARARADADFHIASGKPLQYSGAAAQKVSGWTAFGPKIGSFINNLKGDYSTLTADLWFSRSWNRLLGFSFTHVEAREAAQYQSFKEEVIAERDRIRTSSAGKGESFDDLKNYSDERLDILLGDPTAMLELAEELEAKFKKGQYKEKSQLRRTAKTWVEGRVQPAAAPTRDTLRHFQQQTMEAAQKIVKRRTGEVITIADMQAALWYYEKELFKHLGNSTKASVPADYADAAIKAVREVKNEKPEGKPGVLFQSISGQRDGELDRADRKRSYRANEQGLPIREDGKIPLVHWSKQEGLTSLDPSKHGTGLAGAESARKKSDPDNWVDRTYFAVDAGGYRKEPGLGPHRYNASIPPAQAYDFANDPNGLRPQAAAEFAKNPFANKYSLYEKLIQDAGHSGYWIKHPSMGLLVAVYTPTEVETYQNQPEAGVTLGPAPGDIEEQGGLMFQGATAPFGADNSPSRVDRLIDRVNPKLKEWLKVKEFNYLDKDAPRRDLAKRAGKPLTERTDPLTVERLRGKRTADEIEQTLGQKLVEPLLDFIKHKFAIKEVEDYAYAMHVPERNAQMQRVNAKRYLDRLRKSLTNKEVAELDEIIDNERDRIRKEGAPKRTIQKGYLSLLDKVFADIESGKTDRKPEDLERLQEVKAEWEDVSPRFAGITNDQAEEILLKAKKDPRRYKQLEQARKLLAKINRFRIDTLYEAGQLSEEEHDSLINGYRYYVPLHRDPEQVGYSDVAPPTGRSTGATGRPLKTAKGSTADVVDIFAHSVSNAQQAIVRKHKAEAGEILYNFVKENPGVGIELTEQRKDPHHDDEGNIVMYTPMQERPNELYVRVNGKRYVLTFDVTDAVSMRLLQSIKESDASLKGPMRFLSTVSRTLASVNTMYSPEFVPTNFVRDIGSATVNMEDSEARGMQKKIMTSVFPAVKGILAAEFKGNETSKWSKAYRDFSKHGGKIGWMQGYEGVSDMAKDLQKQLDLLEGKSVPKKVFNGLKDSIEKTNVAIENAVRLSTYQALVEKGVSKQKAALTASNLTVDFTRRGMRGHSINALYMFFNASIQGNVRMVKALSRSRKARALVGGIVGAGAAMQLLAYMMGGDDETGEPKIDSVPDWIKERNMVFITPSGETIQIPMPYGYSVFYNVGQEIARLINTTVFRGEEYDFAKGAMRLANSAAGSFNPLGSGDIFQTISPTILDVPAMIYGNKTWNGSDLVPKENPFGVNKAKAYQHWKSASAPSKWIAQQLHELTGGKEGEYAEAFWDWSPEWIDLFYDNVTGSAGRFVKNTLMLPIDAFMGNEISDRNIPFLRRFYGKPSKQAMTSRYYEELESVKRFEQNAKAEGYVRPPDYHIKWAALRLAKRTEKRLRRLRTYKKRSEAAGKSPDVYNERIYNEQIKFLDRMRAVKYGK